MTSHFHPEFSTDQAAAARVPAQRGGRAHLGAGRGGGGRSTAVGPAAPPSLEQKQAAFHPAQLLPNLRAHDRVFQGGGSRSWIPTGQVWTGPGKSRFLFPISEPLSS